MKASLSRYLLPAAIVQVCLGTILPAQTRDHQATARDTLAVIKTHPMVSGAEWVVMFTDRQTYIAGEHIWYSMHVTAAGLKEEARSIAGYAELLNWSNMPVSQSRIMLEAKGHGSGMLALPDTLSSGDYLLRGYTRAMIPYGPEHYFSKIIRVLNPYSNNTSYNLLKPDGPTGRPLELYTESGVTLPGVVNRVIVKVSGADGKGRAAEVIIRQPDGTPADTVVTSVTGLGSAYLLLPEPGMLTATTVIDSEPAEAQLTVSRQVFHSITLESIAGKGVSIKIIAPERSVRATKWPLHLAVISPGRVTCYRQIPDSTSDAILEIPDSDTGPGIFEALLYDNGGGLLSSRLFLTGTPDGEGDAAVSRWPGQVEDSIRITIPHGTEYVTLSVACDDGDIPDMSTWSMLEPWLTATGINDSFLKPFLSGRAPLSDELLITLGGRSTVPADSPPARVMAETRGLAVTGQAIDLQTLRPASEMLFFINIPGKRIFLQYARSDEYGNFTFIVPPRSGTGEIVIYPQDTTANIILKIASPFSHDFLPIRYSKVKTSDVADDTALRMSINSQVMRIYDIPDNDTLPDYLDHSASKHFYGSAGQHLLLSDYIPLPNMEEVFFELVPGIELIRNRDRYSFRIYDPQTGKEVMEPHLMFIDGTLTTDAETIAGLPPDRTESIDAIIMRYRIGGLLLPPVISVVTKKGDFRLQKLPQSALRINYLFTDIPLKFKPFTGGSNGRIPVFGNTMLWFAAPCDGKTNELSLKVPRPDYESPIRFTSVCFGNSPYPFFVSEPSDVFRR